MVDELREAVKRYTETAGRQNPFTTAVSGLTLLRSDRERRPQPLIHKPALCAAVQGAKREIFGDRQLEYRAGQALIVSFETPAFGTIVEASRRKPFLGVVIEFDLAIMRDVVSELPVPPRAIEPRGPGILVTDLSGPLADSVLRLVRLLDNPAAIPILWPAIMREICFWLLTGRHAGEIMRLTMAKPYESTVIRAIHALRRGFAKAIRIHDLAAMAKMSPTAFHRHFKTMTSMTPLQYQKQLRLIEARRLMLSEALNVESAAFKVGYESPSQFTREYARMFGAAPRRDITALRLADFARHRRS